MTPKTITNFCPRAKWVWRSDARATTLKEFVAALDTIGPDALEGHARRGDFSRWLRDVFGDCPLALAVHALEERCRDERDSTAVPAIASAIRGRYDMTPDTSVPCGAST